MVNAFISMLSGLITWLVAHLPLSPFRGLVFSSTVNGVPIATIMGWVNWLVPFNTMQIMFNAWVTAALAFTAVKYGYLTMFKNVLKGG